MLQSHQMLLFAIMMLFKKSLITLMNQGSAIKSMDVSK